MVSHSFSPSSLPLHKAKRVQLNGKALQVLVEIRYVNQDQNSDMGEGVSKRTKESPTSFMDGPKHAGKVRKKYILLALVSTSGKTLFEIACFT